LLKGGFADGAHARWRSLHEIAVIGFFIKVNGKNTAERYILHERIESYKAAIQYQKFCSYLGETPIPTEEMIFLKKRYTDLLKRFGDSYKEQYGWASDVLDNPQPHFDNIEERVEMQHMRPYYRMASYNVHASPKGIFFKLGLYPKSKEILLAGPSTNGLADPLIGTSNSLVQITTALLTTIPNIDRLVVCNILAKLSNELGKRAIEAHLSVESKSSNNVDIG
jgi:hypothetical protein